MSKPTLQEINDALKTLTAAGLLLDADQTLAVRQVCDEMKLQAEAAHQVAEEQRQRAERAKRLALEEAQRALAAKRQAEEETRRQAQIQKELEQKDIQNTEIAQQQEEDARIIIEQDAHAEELSKFDKVQFGKIWALMNNRKLRTAYKKHLYASGMRGSVCTTRMAHMSYQFNVINLNSAESCSYS